jgi:hypothetical protein
MPLKLSCPTEQGKLMPAPLLLIPAAIVVAIKAYFIKHALHISASAAMAAAIEYCRSRDADKAAQAAMRAGARAASGDAIRDFFS